jgi:hypothetical protein
VKDVVPKDRMKPAKVLSAFAFCLVSACVLIGSALDSSFVEQNQFKKIYRVKTPRRKEKISFYLSELGVLCAFARVIFF